eukprot:CAMPEP_0205825606 /NCGR_PEP_ID=MMETSP0206-20130828/25842_1 /ASSEMBLY_ACC=CAM_ASM_000279 /TAXON_ID=36767 /ORGANISM="Euplotes focardii, Strain TN1" /LENGTH=71 /DNA_ID=CAMNT_0053124787 /DNA_START=450 /DNA_END=665 /DNA_ORIENTATION=+
MKENIEEEERMMDEMRKAQSGEYPEMDEHRPVIKKKFREDEDIDPKEEIDHLLRKFKSRKHLDLDEHEESK